MIKAETYTTLIFDLDETLYESNTGIWEAIRDRINLYMHERVGLDWNDIPGLRTRLFSTYGTTLRGLITLFDVNPEDYLEYVHDIPMKDLLKPDPEVRKTLETFPHQKIVFTNADRNHANRVLEILNIRDLFEKIIDIRDIAPYCKPMPEAFEKALAMAGVSPKSSIMLDDSQPNLATARMLGMGTIRVGSDQFSWDYDECIRRIHDLPAVLAQNGHNSGEVE